MIVRVTNIETHLIEEEDVPVITVVLERGEESKVFFCPTCRRSILQYKGKIAYILPGSVPCNLPLTVRCKDCKTNYLFRTNV